MNFLTNSKLYAFDINPINPTIAPHFSLIDVDDSISQYGCESNLIFYVTGDVFKESSWSPLKKVTEGPLDVIFSDAHHTGEGLLAEYNYYIKDALAPNFILYYDDLHNPANGMPDAFKQIFANLKTIRPNITGAFLEANGWLGHHEFRHLNGIITSLDLREVLSRDCPSIPVDYLELQQ